MILTIYYLFFMLILLIFASVMSYLLFYGFKPLSGSHVMYSNFKINF